MSKAQKQKLRAFLKQDRQWKRHHRLAHARFELSRSNTEAEKEFWQAVLDTLS